jgi:vacuolar protein sorting-associated protein 1
LSLLAIATSFYLSISVQATAIVNDRLNASKPPPGPPDPKNTRAQVNNNKDLEVDARKDEVSFFGSFFSAKTGTTKKKGSVMEAPPAIIKPQAALSERETMETEVISCVFLFVPVVI